MATETAPSFQKFFDKINQVDPIRMVGRVDQLIGLVIEAIGPASSVGEICHIYSSKGHSFIQAEVVGFRNQKILLMPLGELQGIGPGSTLVATGKDFQVPVGDSLIGRVVDGLARPIDGRGNLWTSSTVSVHREPPDAMARHRIKKALSTGVRSIDGLLTIGQGQRIGIFSGSGVGKSTLMGMVARESEADVNVIALIGERGREVKDFIDRDLGETGLAKSVVIVATSDQPALIRRQGALVATAIAEYFRDQGKNVMFMMDSVTRFAMAQREIGLAVGEPPTTKGYTPSVFALLPKLLERAGTTDHTGTITGLYTVLVEADDINEPVGDTVRAILDGHIILSRDLASQNHYPPVDILESVSRLMVDIAAPDHKWAAGQAREILANYRNARDLINIGAYVRGSDPKIDRSLSYIDAINTFLKQGIEETDSLSHTVERLKAIFSQETPKVAS
jgi:flagellum-specific ATP synthase